MRGVRLVAAAALLCAAACSDDSGSSPARKAPAAPEPDASYTTVVELRDAYLAAGGRCPHWVQTNRITEAAESGECSRSMVLSTYATPAALDRAVDDLKSLKELFHGDSDPFLVGPNWILNGPQSVDVAGQLGGTLQR